MSRISAGFFSWVESAPFYVELHSQAVDLLPRGDGKTWLDVGCGPGLVATLAADRGYATLGIDRDAEVIRAAQRKAHGSHRCRFEVGDLASISNTHSADVVSAASLLFVLPDPVIAMQQLWNVVRPGGNLLIIETSVNMTQENSDQVKKTMPPGRHRVLDLWTRTRNGRAISPEVFHSLSDAQGEQTFLLDGLIQTWVYSKKTNGKRDYLT